MSVSQAISALDTTKPHAGFENNSPDAAKQEFSQEYAAYESALTQNLKNSAEHKQALAKLKAAKITFIQDIDSANKDNQTLFDKAIILAHMKFSKTLIFLFAQHDLEDELDKLIKIEKPDYSHLTSDYFVNLVAA